MPQENNQQIIIIDFQPLVMRDVEKLYDRYFRVAAYSVDTPILSFNDFVNQLLIRGLVEHNKDLIEIEKQLGIIS